MKIRNKRFKRIGDLRLEEYWQIIFTRIWWLLGIASGLGVVGLSTSFLLPEVYLSESVIEWGELSTLTPAEFTDGDLEQIVALELANDSEYASFHKSVSSVREDISITAVAGRSFRITYKARDPHLAQRGNEQLVSLLVREASSPTNQPNLENSAGHAIRNDYQGSAAAVNRLGASASRSRVLERASLPLKPSEPNRVAFVVVGFLCGCLLGAAGALAQAISDQHIRSERELARLSNFPVLASIPRVSQADRFRARR